jgi:hypothetical protein
VTHVNRHLMCVDKSDQTVDTSCMGTVKIESDFNGTVHVGCDLYAPPRFDATVTGQEEGPDIAAVITIEGGRYVVQELRITRQAGGPPITSELIRKIPVQTLLRGAVANGVDLRLSLQPGKEGPSIQSVTPVYLSQPERDRLVAAGPADETLLWVARFYILAKLAGDPPAKFVREAFGVPTSTAGYWIRRAKDRKILDG